MSRLHSTRLLAVLIYFSGTLGQGVHLLTQPFQESSSSAGSEAALSTLCDCPGPCQDPKHHPASRPAHDHAHCVVCQQVFLAGEMPLPASPVVDRDRPQEGLIEGPDISPFSEILATHPARGPPSIS